MCSYIYGLFEKTIAILVGNIVLQAIILRRRLVTYCTSVAFFFSGEETPIDKVIAGCGAAIFQAVVVTVRSDT